MTEGENERIQQKKHPFGKRVEKQYDKGRTEYLESVGLFVIRFTNEDIWKRFEGACLAIDEQVRKSLPPSATHPPPSSEGGKWKIAD